MRQSMIERTVLETRLQRVDTRAVQRLPDVFVARLKCTRLRPKRCTHQTVGIRRPEEYVAWRETKCAKCRGRMIPVGSEAYAEIEVNAAIQVLRWRPVDLETKEPTGDWEFLPFALAGQLEELAATGG